ncbi:MAG: PD-(D/E)XK nuclease family protein [Pirellulales bacterium]
MASDEDNGESHGALERFVVENDELLQLEERVGRFNIFDALGIVRVEIRHSNFLAWLLDPNESHGQGSLFLNGILMGLLRQSAPALRPFSPIKLDGAEMRGVRVRREYRNIDILIECDEPRFVIAIENKIGSREHSDQLGRYKKTVKELFGDVPTQFVYLTREGDEPSDGDWTTYTYRDIHDTLQRIRKSNSSSIGGDVLTFLEHYLNLLRSRFMDDPDIDELCQTIYKNHRQAIDLIVERIGTGSEAIGAIAEEISKLSGWSVAYRGPRYVQVIPVGWERLLPPIGKRKVVPPEQWLVITFRLGPRQCSNTVNVTPTTDAVLRRKVIERLVADPKEFGLKSLFKNVDLIGDNWAALGRINIERWNPEEGPDIDKLLPKVRAVLDRRAKELAEVPAALGPVIAEWSSSSKR